MSPPALPSGKTHKSLPRRTNRHHTITNGFPVRPNAFDDELDSPDPALLPKSPFEYPVLTNGRDSGLPPTPPSNSAEKRARTSSDKFTHTNGAPPLLLSRTSTASTPLNQRSPPTPDITPPGSLNTPPRRSPSRQSSSQAESFQTAREDQWSSDEEGGTGSAANGTFKPLRSGAVEVIHSHIPEVGLCLAAFETEEDDDVTPRQSRLKISKSPKDALPNDTTDLLDQIPGRERDKMRNVAIPHKKSPLPKPVNTAIEPALNPGEFSTTSPRQTESRVDQSPRTPNSPNFPKDLDWSPRSRTMASHLQNSGDSKRASIQSTNSTIVEAIVIATPPQRQRTLRHVGKNMSLRSDSGSSPERSPISYTNTASFHSNGASSHVIRHKRPLVTTRNVPGISEAPVRRKSPAPAVPLKHHRESQSLRSDAAKSAKIFRDPNPRPLGGDSPVTQSIQTPSQMNHIVGTAATVSPTKRTTGKSTHDGVTTRVKFTDSTKALADEKEVTQVSQVSLTRSATQKALKAIIPMPDVESEAVSPKSTGKLPTAAAAPMGHEDIRNTIPENILRRISLDISPSAASALATRLLAAPPDSFSMRHSSDDSTTEEVRRQSFDRSTIGTHEFARYSLDRANSHTEEHAIARHLSGQLTPFSQTSDLPESMEVSEATAVNIYPHNNHSLLVVQQGAKSIQLVRNNTVESTNSYEPPSVTVQPSTPPPQSTAPASADSPLKNPRKPPQPPQPPAIKILPPTPLDEIESPIDQAGKTVQLIRRPTLAQRARRYSDAFVAPIIARTASIRRNVRRAAEPTNNQEQQEAGKLHPFWHPRGFWDEVSESDSEFDEDEDNCEEGSAHLPPGGDTTELGEPRGLARVFNDFRGNGGFLIGNTLGVERQPTNRRRHYVAMPTNLMRSASGRVQKKGSQGSLDNERQSVSQKQKKRKVWKGMGLHVEYLGFRGLQDLVRAKKAEKRRERLKSKIGNRWTVEGTLQVTDINEV